MVGTTLSHYRVLESLGAGGMGEVYLAEDTRLGRKVALKLLPPALARDEAARARFVREARAASRLDHPHICAVHDIDDAGDGRLLIAMAYCEGETLKQRLARAAMPVGDVVDVACQIADGLAEAHAHDIVHRDIKPANVMVTRTSRVKIVDFGLAHFPESERLTATGVTFGTPAYMSPEQVRGEEVDARTDLWSLGVVLYEMLTGRRPFRGESPQAVLYAIVNRTPEPLDRLRPDLPADLVRIVSRALVKDPIGRYQQAEQMLADLRACRERLSGANLQPAIKAEHPPSIAVLPFANLSPDKEQEYFCDGMTEEVITALGLLQGLRVAAQTSTFQLKGQGLSVRQIGERLGVDAVVEGSVRKAGDRLRITAQLVNVSDGYHLWSERFDRRLDDVFSVQDEIARAIVDRLRGALPTAAEPAAVRTRAATPQAYELYLQGRYYFTRRYQGLLQPAADCFRRATELDADYAPAHAGLADALAVSGWFGFVPREAALEPARRAAERAITLDEALPDGHHALAMVHCYLDWNWDVIEREFRRALALNPNLPLTRAYYAVALVPVGRFDDATRELERGLSLDPLSPLQLYLSSTCCSLMREDDRALAYAQKLLELEPESVLGLLARGWALSHLGRHADGIETLTRGVTLSKRMAYFLMFLGEALVRAGHRTEGLEVLQELVDRSTREPAVRVFAAYLHVALGDFDAALALFDQGTYASPLAFAPRIVDPFRHHPRFPVLLRAFGYTGTALLARGAGM